MSSIHGPIRPGEQDRLDATIAALPPAPELALTAYSNGVALIEPELVAVVGGESAARIRVLEAQAEIAAKYGVRALSDITPAPPAPLIADRIAPDGHTILFGDGGIGKGVITSAWIAELVKLDHDVLVVDYENNPDEWSRRVNGLGGPETAERVHHVAPTAKTWHGAPGALWEHIDDIGELAETYNASVIVIDSIIIGCHGFDPSDSAAASNYSAAVARLERPVVSIGHTTKQGAGKYPFGSIVWHNAARLTWGLERVAGGVLMRCRKSNNYATPPRYLVSTTWRDDVPREVWEKPYAVALEDTVLAVLEDEPMTFADVWDRVNEAAEDDETPTTKAALTKVLQRARSRGYVVLDGAKWSLKS